MNSSYYTPVSSGAPIYTSRTVRRITVGRSDSQMSYGDRMSVRILQGDDTVMTYETRQVADMTDLMGDLRRRAKNLKGLVVVQIRNCDRGWAKERRTMLYAQRKHVAAHRPAAVQVPMFFPWEL